MKGASRRKSLENLMQVRLVTEVNTQIYPPLAPSTSVAQVVEHDNGTPEYLHKSMILCALSITFIAFGFIKKILY